MARLTKPRKPTHKPKRAAGPSPGTAPPGLTMAGQLKEVLEMCKFYEVDAEWLAECEAMEDRKSVV